MERPCGTQDMGERVGRFVFGGRGGVMADICTAHGHLRWFIYPRPPDQASDLPEFVRLEGAPYHTTQFLTFHISSHFQLPVSLYHSTRPNPVQANYTQFQQSRKNRPASATHEKHERVIRPYGLLHLDRWMSKYIYVGVSFNCSGKLWCACKKEVNNSICDPTLQVNR